MSEDEKLKELALKDWALFLALLGKGAMNDAKARLLRNQGKSYAQIALKLGMTISQVRTAVKN